MERECRAEEQRGGKDGMDGENGAKRRWNMSMEAIMTREKGRKSGDQARRSIWGMCRNTVVK